MDWYLETSPRFCKTLAQELAPVPKVEQICPLQTDWGSFGWQSSDLIIHKVSCKELIGENDRIMDVIDDGYTPTKADQLYSLGHCMHEYRKMFAEPPLIPWSEMLSTLSYFHAVEIYCPHTCFIGNEELDIEIPQAMKMLELKENIHPLVDRSHIQWNAFELFHITWITEHLTGTSCISNFNGRSIDMNREYFEQSPNQIESWITGEVHTMDAIILPGFNDNKIIHLMLCELPLLLNDNQQTTIFSSFQTVTVHYSLPSPSSVHSQHQAYIQEIWDMDLHEDPQNVDARLPIPKMENDEDAHFNRVPFLHSWKLNVCQEYTIPQSPLIQSIANAKELSRPLEMEILDVNFKIERIDMDISESPIKMKGSQSKPTFQPNISVSYNPLGEFLAQHNHENAFKVQKPSANFVAEHLSRHKSPAIGSHLIIGHFGERIILKHVLDYLDTLDRSERLLFVTESCENEPNLPILPNPEFFAPEAKKHISYHQRICISYDHLSLCYKWTEMSSFGFAFCVIRSNLMKNVQIIQAWMTSIPEESLPVLIVLSSVIPTGKIEFESLLASLNSSWVFVAPFTQEHIHSWNIPPDQCWDDKVLKMLQRESNMIKKDLIDSGYPLTCAESSIKDAHADMIQAALVLESGKGDNQLCTLIFQYSRLVRRYILANFKKRFEEEGISSAYIYLHSVHNDAKVVRALGDGMFSILEIVYKMFKEVQAGTRLSHPKQRLCASELLCQSKCFTQACTAIIVSSRHVRGDIQALFDKVHGAREGNYKIIEASDIHAEFDWTLYSNIIHYSGECDILDTNVTTTVFRCTNDTACTETEDVFKYNIVNWIYAQFTKTSETTLLNQWQSNAKLIASTLMHYDWSAMFTTEGILPSTAQLLTSSQSPMAIFSEPAACNMDLRAKINSLEGIYGPLDVRECMFFDFQCIATMNEGLILLFDETSCSHILSQVFSVNPGPYEKIFSAYSSLWIIISWSPQYTSQKSLQAINEQFNRQKSRTELPTTLFHSLSIDNTAILIIRICAISPSETSRASGVFCTSMRQADHMYHEEEVAMLNASYLLNPWDVQYILSIDSAEAFTCQDAIHISKQYPDLSPRLHSAFQSLKPGVYPTAPKDTRLISDSPIPHTPTIPIPGARTSTCTSSKRQRRFMSPYRSNY